MRQLLYIFAICWLVQHSFAQDNDLPYESYRENIVVHTSLSYKDAPFNLRGDFGNVNQLHYSANLNLIHGIGFAYKWFSFNLNYKIPSYLKNIEKYGKTKYFDLGAQFFLKDKLFFRVDFQDYNGYGIKQAHLLHDSLPVSPVNYHLMDDVKSWALGINVYYLISEELNMKAAIGFTSRYNTAAHGFYLRFTTNIHGISSDHNLIPYKYIQPPTEKNIIEAKSISAFDFGAVPGYAYINNINGWQFGVFAGIGGVVQAKFYSNGIKNRGFLGIAPRLDTRIQGGYNVDKWFVMLNTTFDLKTIQFSNLNYDQMYFSLQLTYGYRFQTKATKKKAKNK